MCLGVGADRGDVPGVGHVLGWDGLRWRNWGCRWETDASAVQEEAGRYMGDLVPHRYDVAYNLNQHARAITAAHLCAACVQGPGLDGVLTSTLPPWATYLRTIAVERGENRVHLADAFCGLCGVRPPANPPQLTVLHTELPHDLAAVGERDGMWVAVVLGAGDRERVIPGSVWKEWIVEFLQSMATGQILLIGTGMEREVARAIQDDLTGLQLGRVWDATGRLSLRQLAICLQRCAWVLGADTGPLHLGAAVGARAMGWYVARARAHETGPYGSGHMVWQWQSVTGGPAPHRRDYQLRPCTQQAWPIRESVALLLSGTCEIGLEGWSLLRSHFDDWGTYYTAADENGSSISLQRKDVWTRLHLEPTDIQR